MAHVLEIARGQNGRNDDVVNGQDDPERLRGSLSGASDGRVPSLAGERRFRDSGYRSSSSFSAVKGLSPWPVYGQNESRLDPASNFTYFPQSSPPTQTRSSRVMTPRF